MILKPQDIFTVLKLIAIGEADWSYAKLAVDLGMSTSEVHAAIKRSLQARLAVQYNLRIRPNIQNIHEFLIHGIRYVFIPERGEITRGVPTIHGAAFLEKKLASSGSPPPVWPDPEGAVRGESFSPLYRSAPSASRKDDQFYELLVLVDALRAGNTREHKLAVSEIQKRFDHYREISKSQS
jgi:hypothetical protein